jgi:hypothetical protein
MKYHMTDARARYERLAREKKEKEQKIRDVAIIFFAVFILILFI